MKKMSVAILLAAALVFFSFAAEAGTITIFNNSGYDIHELYISPSGTQGWGQDLFGNGYLEDGDEYDVRIPNCDEFDLMVADSRGNQTDWYEIPGKVVRFYVDPNKQARWEWD